VDIRKVGSGNVGATNAARVLGARYFLPVSGVDYLKGLLPTLLFPAAAERWSQTIAPGLPVAVAVAAILGHNFPAYLGFRGGKGVATSLGAVTALDAVASLAAVVAFAFTLAVTRIVSLSSILGALAFTIAHFNRATEPWGADELAMSVATCGLLALLIVRHRANLVRIIQGTEPRMRLRRKDEPKERSR
jgi:glycerol-3-phosphate acyltransferase PlsY